MHRLFLGVCCALALVAPASATPVCLKTYFIKSTKVIDAKTIDFQMRDGSVYRNNMPASCTGLLFNGFSYRVHADEICDNSQSIRVLRSGEVCLLGAFTKLPPPKPDSH
ncbi:MAG TPA: hypothetical protein VMJ73_00095 [Rhizomicrobium sp.]|nr:hypothetical protein [Rhizomicrobium sp.]